MLELLLSVPFVPPAVRLIDRRRVAILCAAALVAIPAGAALLVAVDEDVLRVALTALAVAGSLDRDALALAGALAVPYLLAALTGARAFEGTGERLYRRIA